MSLRGQRRSVVKYESGVAHPGSHHSFGKGTEIADVFGHDGASFQAGVLKHIRVRRPTARCFVDGYDIVPAPAELIGDYPRVHLVEQQLHPLAVRAREMRTAASAASSLRRIQSSISDRWAS